MRSPDGWRLRIFRSAVPAKRRVLVGLGLLLGGICAGAIFQPLLLWLAMLVGLLGLIGIGDVLEPVIILDAGSLRIRFRPLHLGGGVTIPTDHVAQLYVHDRGLAVRQKSGVDQYLIGWEQWGGREDQLFFAKRAVERCLGLPDRTVVGGEKRPFAPQDRLDLPADLG